MEMKARLSTPMIFAISVDIMLGGEQLAALGRIDAVEAGMGGRRAGDAHMHLLGARRRAPSRRSSSGGAAHDAVVHQDHALALDRGAVGVVLQLHAEMADMVGRLDEGAADIVVADDAELEGNARLGCIADRRGHARIGHRDRPHRPATARLAGQLGADALARLIDAACPRRCCRAGRNRCIRRCRSGAARRGRACSDWTPAAVEHDHLAGSTSRTNSAPMMSSAQVSEARIWREPSLPSTSGRTPRGSRTPITMSWASATRE